MMCICVYVHLCQRTKGSALHECTNAQMHENTTNMPTPDTNFDEHNDETPPALFRSWSQMYAFVLILHAIIIALFYIFTHAYS